MYFVIYAQTRIYPKNETHKILRDFEIQMDLQVPIRIPDSVLLNNKKSLDFTSPADHRVKIILKKRKKINKYFALNRRWSS